MPFTNVQGKPFRESIRYLVLGIRNTKSKILNTKYRKGFGFTLIELLVVISIIGILVAGATASWTNAQRKSRDAKRKSDLKAIQQTLELYFQTNGKYPDSGGTGQIQCNVTGDSHSPVWGTSFYCTPSGGSQIIYMNPLPKESVFTGANEVYFYQASGTPSTSYILSALLENANDADVAAGLPCTPQPDRNYCVINP